MNGDLRFELEALPMVGYAEAREIMDAGGAVVDGNDIVRRGHECIPEEGYSVLYDPRKTEHQLAWALLTGGEWEDARGDTIHARAFPAVAPDTIVVTCGVCTLGITAPLRRRRPKTKPAPAMLHECDLREGVRVRQSAWCAEAHWVVQPSGLLATHDRIVTPVMSRHLRATNWLQSTPERPEWHSPNGEVGDE